MKNYLIVGASGSVGSLVANTLAQQGVQVHALTSKRERSDKVEGNIRWLFADLKSGEGVNASFENVDRAFIFAPPGYVPQNTIVSPLIKEATRRKLEKVVLLTALGANAVETAPLRIAELELERSGLAYNIVRPNWFMQNFNTFWIHGINEQGKILLPTGKAKGSFIDVRDIANVVVRLLTSDDLNNRDFDITGAQSLDHDEVAAILSHVSGRAITYQEITPESLKQAFLGAGLPEDYADFLLLILGFFAQGYSADITTSVKELLGREPISFEQYAEDYKQAWIR
jgi:uncharacterized protein YbjT (DUF2867 family)